MSCPLSIKTNKYQVCIYTLIRNCGRLKIWDMVLVGGEEWQTKDWKSSSEKYEVVY